MCDNMLENVIALLIVLWVIGIVTGVTLGGLVYLLLIISIAALIVRISRINRGVTEIGNSSEKSDS